MHADPAPRPSRQPLSNVQQVRLSPTQRRYVVWTAASRGISKNEVIRELIDRAIARAKPLHLEGEESLPPELRSKLPLRVILDSLDESALERLAGDDE